MSGFLMMYVDLDYTYSEDRSIMLSRSEVSEKPYNNEVESESEWRLKNIITYTSLWSELRN